MYAIRLACAALLRDWRSGELQLMAAAVVIAVAALTTVAVFTDRVQRAIELQATELLAADLVLESSEAVAAEVIEAAAAAGLDSTRTVGFRSMAVAGGQLELSEVKAVEQGYPLRGRMRTAAALFGTESEENEIPAAGTAWLDSRLMQALGVGINDRITLGAAEFTFDRLLAYEPDRGGDLFNIGPRVLINLADLPRTQLILPGSRVQHRLLLRGPGREIGTFREWIESRKDVRLKVHGIRDARPELRTALERAEQFLRLAVLVGIALCGLAIAMSARRYALRHYDTCAVLRCLGATQTFISRFYVIQLLMLALFFSAVGCAVGALCQEGLALLLGGLTSRELPPPSLLPLGMGLIAGGAAVLGFALPWIGRLRSVSPLRVFRRDLAPIPPSGLSVYGAAILVLALLVPWQAGEVRMTAYVLLGLAGTATALVFGALGTIRLSARLRSRLGISWRYGIANLSRRARGSIAQVLGIGLGTTAILLLTLVRTDLLNAWENRLPPGTPNYFLINIQPDEVPALGDFLRERAMVATRLYPMVRGRLIRVNDQEIIPGRYEEPRAQRLAGREFNLSWADRMQTDNRLVAGEWWPKSETGEVYFSVEEEIARTLGIGLGDTLTYLVAGREIGGRVRNLRRVDWDSFNVNFFVIASPGALEEYPATYISSFHLSDDRRSLLTELVRRFPSVTVIDVAALMHQVRAIMEQVSRTVEFVSAFTLAAGLIVLIAAVQTTQDERRQESAVLRSLGASRRRILSALSAEFAVLGAIAGVLAAAGATLIEWILARFIFELEISFNPWVWSVGPIACVAVIVAGGYLGTRKILAVPAIEALRRI